MTDDKNEENPKVGYRKTLTNVKAIAHAQKASRVLFTVTSFRAAAGFWAACPCKGREECCSSERHMQNTSFAMWLRLFHGLALGNQLQGLRQWKAKELGCVGLLNRVLGSQSTYFSHVFSSTVDYSTSTEEKGWTYQKVLKSAFSTKHAGHLAVLEACPQATATRRSTLNGKSRNYIPPNCI